jgi:hypothetical protein
MIIRNLNFSQTYDGITHTAFEMQMFFWLLSEKIPRMPSVIAYKVNDTGFRKSFQCTVNGCAVIPCFQYGLDLFFRKSHLVIQKHTKNIPPAFCFTQVVLFKNFNGFHFLRLSCKLIKILVQYSKQFQRSGYFFREEFSRIRTFTIYKAFRGSFIHQVAALLPTLRTKVNHPVGIFNYIRIVLNDDNRMSFFN